MGIEYVIKVNIIPMGIKMSTMSK